MDDAMSKAYAAMPDRLYVVSLALFGMLWPLIQSEYGVYITQSKEVMNALIEARCLESIGVCLMHEMPFNAERAMVVCCDLIRRYTYTGGDDDDELDALLMEDILCLFVVSCVLPLLW